MKVTDPEVRDRQQTGGSGIGIVVGILVSDYRTNRYCSTRLHHDRLDALLSLK